VADSRPEAAAPSYSEPDGYSGDGGCSTNAVSVCHTGSGPYAELNVNDRYSWGQNKKFIVKRRRLQ